MQRLPATLIYLRLCIGILLFLLSWLPAAVPVVLLVSLIAVGLLTDVFDGIIARRLQVSTEALRRLDSTIDLIFWCLVAVSVFVSHPLFFSSHAAAIITLVLLEALTYAVSYIRFKKEVATHSIPSKIWTLLLFATLTQVICSGGSGWLFTLCFYVGMATRLEVLAILFILRHWTPDVPSVYHALRLRAGKPVTRNKLFNG